VTLPVGVSGSFYFLVKTDANGEVFENGATANNVRATDTPRTVNLTPPPDLAVTAVTAPTAGLASHALTFTYHVSNAGAGGTPNTSWVDSYYLSPTATYNAGTAIPLGQQTHQGRLNAGDGYDNTVSLTLPNGLSGAFYLIVSTDSGHAVFELDRTHSFGATASAIQVASMPADLVVSAAAAPASALAGTAVQVSWTVTDQGTGDTAVTSWLDSVYASTAATFDSRAVLLGTFAHTGLLNAGGSYSQAQLVTLPLALSGSYNLFVVTNTTAQGLTPGAVYESDTTNNVSAAQPIAVTQQLADLRVSGLTAPSSANTGDAVTVRWTVSNNGTGATNSTYWYDDVWLSTHTTLASGGTDVYLGTVQHTNPLAAGGSYDASVTVTLPQTLAPGSYYFLVAADRPVAPPGHSQGVNLVFESNNTNKETATPTPASIGLGAVADLAASNVTAPATATSGQVLTVSWTVTNSGAATGNVPITDAVYLSLVPEFVPNLGRSLGTLTHSGGLAAGGSCTQSGSFQVPVGLAGTYYVVVVTNANGAVYERNTANNAAAAAQPTQIQLAPLANLVAGTVTIPVNAVPGENITVSYQVSNNGANAALGTWTDALYLSPTPTWVVSDPLLGYVPQHGPVAPDGSYTGTLTAAVPGVAPGSYYVILRSNILNNLAETTQDDNLSASLTQAAIDAPALTLGTPASGTLSQGQSAFYKVVVGAGQTLQVRLTSQTAAASNELYISYGTTPTRGHYDYRYSQPLSANQQITVATTQAGAYYILAYGAGVPGGSESYALTASLIPFSVAGVSPGQVGAGRATVEVDGAKFDNGTTFQLLGANATVVGGQQVFLQDSSTAFVTFDLTGKPAGTYDVRATHADGTTALLAQGLTVVVPLSGNLQIYLSLPNAVLPGSQSSVTVNYVNRGNTDVLAPLLQLTANGALVRLADQSAFNGNSVWLLGIAGSGPAGVLRPGQGGQVSIPFRTTATAGQQVTFNILIADDTRPMDWNSQKDALWLPTLPAAAWDGVFANFVATVGPTVASYHAALAADASYLGRFGQATPDVLQLVAFEMEKADAAFTPLPLAAVTDDSLPAPGLALAFQRQFSQPIAGRYSQGLLGYGWATNWDLSAGSDSSGNAILHQQGAIRFFARQADGSFQASPGDRGHLTFTNGAYRLVEADGTAYQFNATGTLGYVQDRNGNRITAGYNAAGQLVSLTHSSGQALTLTYNAQGHLAALTDSSGLTEAYGYDPSGQFLTTLTDRYGTTTYTYVIGQSAARNNALASITYPDNTHLFFTYDAAGRLIDRQRDGGAEDQGVTYLSPGGYTVTDGLGSPTTVYFDLYGEVGESIDALGQTTHYQRDSNLNLVGLTAPLGNRYSATYDSNGNLASLTDPLGNTTRFTYDANNDLLTYTDANGHTTRYGYDGNRNLLSVTYATGARQQYSYDALGQAMQFLNARGHAVGYTYNAQGRVTGVAFADGTSYAYTYDNRGHLTSATDAQGGVTQFVYGDPTNPDLLTEVDYPDTTFLRFSYNTVQPDITIVCAKVFCKGGRWRC
jgi:YD repeat-containing protein